MLFVKYGSGLGVALILTLLSPVVAGAQTASATDKLRYFEDKEAFREELISAIEQVTGISEPVNYASMMYKPAEVQSGKSVRRLAIRGPFSWDPSKKIELRKAHIDEWAEDLGIDITRQLDLGLSCLVSIRPAEELANDVVRAVFECEVRYQFEDGAVTAFTLAELNEIGLAIKTFKEGDFCSSEGCLSFVRHYRLSEMFDLEEGPRMEAAPRLP